MSWIQTAFAFSGLILSSFGPVSDLIQAKNPWFGFQADGAVLWATRIQKVPSQSCSTWAQALLEDTRDLGVQVPSAIESEKSWESVWSEWGPWNRDDEKAVIGCHDFPCLVKFDANEVAQMAAVGEKERQRKFRSLVASRSLRYHQTGQRKEYEFPGDPVEPWGLFEKRGLTATVARPEKDQLWVRKNDFVPGKLLTIRQVLDRRASKNPSGTEATVWIRDAYTDHYFDGWGEWIHLECDQTSPGAQGVILIHSMILELDGLKKTDFFSKIMRGKMRSAVEQNAATYLDRAFERIRHGAEFK